jgi:hypothetical protein
VKLDGGFGRSAHQPAASGACPCRTVCVYGVTGCTAESSRAFSGNAPVLCSTVVDAARNGGSGSQAHSSRGWASKLLCMLDVQPRRRLPPHPLCNPPSTGHPPRFVVEACSEGPSHERMPTCVSTAHLHQPRLQPTLGAGWQSTLRVLSGHPRTRGRMPTRVMIPPHLHSPRCPTYHLVQREGNRRAIFDPRSRGGTTRRVLRSRVTPHEPPRITHVRW